jgi:hypothetical protein
LDDRVRNLVRNTGDKVNYIIFISVGFMGWRANSY